MKMELSESQGMTLYIFYNILQQLPNLMKKFSCFEHVMIFVYFNLLSTKIVMCSLVKLKIKALLYSLPMSNK